VSHANAALTPRHRLRLARLVVDDGWPPSRAAEFFHVSWRTAVRRRIPRQCLFPTLAAEMRPPQRLPVEVAAQIGHDREPSTETPPSPPPPPPSSSERPGARAGGGGGRIRTRSQPTQATDPVEHWQQRHQSLPASCGIADDHAGLRTVSRVCAGGGSRWPASGCRRRPRAGRPSASPAASTRPRSRGTDDPGRGAAAVLPLSVLPATPLCSPSHTAS